MSYVCKARDCLRRSIETNRVEIIYVGLSLLVIVFLVCIRLNDLARGIGVGVVIGALSAFLGFRLEKGERRREAKERKCKIRSVLSLEIKQNLDEVDGFWVEVQAEINKKEKPAKGPEQKAYRLAIIPLPTFTRIMWESQATYLPEVLEPDEFGSANQLHALFNTLTTIHRYLEQQRPDAEGQPKGPKKTEKNPWEKYSPGQWYAFESAVEKIKKIGNPLAGCYPNKRHLEAS